MILKENFDIRPAVLFARSDSIYKSLDCDVWDIERDARNWPGGAPVVAHPPCRAWGRLRGLAKPLPGEKQLAHFAINQVRKFGGVLEHPAHSTLWRVAGLPYPGYGMDVYGGWTMPIIQQWFGHRAEKATWLYIVGCDSTDLPDYPYLMAEASHIVGGSFIKNADGTRKKKGDKGWRPSVTKTEREHTPELLARWLLEVSKRCAS